MTGGSRDPTPARPQVEEDFPEESFALLRDLEPTSFWFRGRNALIAWALAVYFPVAESVLDAGCGTGFVLSGLRQRRPGLRLVGAEPFRAGLEIARERVPDAELVLADARRLPFKSTFDVVGCFDVLEHVEEDEDVLAELHRVTSPGGGLLLTVPQHPRLWSAADDFGGHKRRYVRRDLTTKVANAGYRVVRVTSFMTFLLPILAGSRLLRRADPQAYDAAAEFRLPRWLDATFDAVFAWERWMIGSGVSFPVGSSLLVIARRD